MKTDTKEKLSINHAIEFIIERVKPLTQMIAPIGEPAAIHRIECPIENIDILDWLSSQETDNKFYFSTRQEEMQAGTLGIADILDDTNQENLKEAMEALKLRYNFLNPNLQFYGGIAFNETMKLQEWQPFGRFHFFAPRLEIRQNAQGSALACNIAYKDIVDERIKTILDELNAVKPISTPRSGQLPKPADRRDSPDKSEWARQFGTVMNSIRKKTIEKVVLARKSTFTFDAPVDAFYLKKKLKGLTPECYHFCYQKGRENIFIGASPERLFKRTDKNVQSEAVAGTRANTSNDKKLQDSPKDLREHHYVAGTIEKALKSFCTKISKDNNPSILPLHWGEHLKTGFEGTLRNGVTDCDLIHHIHPSPAVAGYPCKEALEFIKYIETFSRGWYCGLIGYVGQNESEFAVAIRSGLIQGSNISLFAGAGIIEESTAEREWDEIEQKMNSFLKVFD